MSGTLVTEIKQSVQLKKINHGFPLRQNNVNGVWVYLHFPKFINLFKIYAAHHNLKFLRHICYIPVKCGGNSQFIHNIVY
jgi:hypothetical protein